MRSTLALLAAAWFVLNAMDFLPPSVAGDSAGGGLIGEDAAVAITVAARTLFAGLTLLSLALVEWGKLWLGLRDALTREPDEVGPYGEAGAIDQ